VRPAARALTIALVWWLFPFALLFFNASHAFQYVAPSWMRIDLHQFTDAQQQNTP
jgi:hypothetical protein